MRNCQNLITRCFRPCRQVRALYTITFRGQCLFFIFQLGRKQHNEPSCTQYSTWPAKVKFLQLKQVVYWGYQQHLRIAKTRKQCNERGKGTPIYSVNKHLLNPYHTPNYEKSDTKHGPCFLEVYSDEIPIWTCTCLLYLKSIAAVFVHALFSLSPHQSKRLIRLQNFMFTEANPHIPSNLSISSHKESFQTSSPGIQLVSKTTINRKN